MQTSFNFNNTKKDYFKGIEKEDLKKHFKKLSRQLHPDFNNGQDSEFKEMLNQYEKVKDKKTSGSFKKSKDFNLDEMTEDFIKAFNSIINLDLDIEVLGTWIWVGGETYDFKDILKQNGFKWANKKKQWYFGKRETKGKALSMDKIRSIHSTNFEKKQVGRCRIS